MALRGDGTRTWCCTQAGPHSRLWQTRLWSDDLGGLIASTRDIHMEYAHSHGICPHSCTHTHQQSAADTSFALGFLEGSLTAELIFPEFQNYIENLQSQASADTIKCVWLGGGGGEVLDVWCTVCGISVADAAAMEQSGRAVDGRQHGVGQRHDWQEPNIAVLATCGLSL